MEILAKYKRTEEDFRKKLSLFFFLIILSSLVLIFRLIYINVFSESVVGNLKSSYRDFYVIKIPRYRGTITDRNGKVLAVSYPVGYVYTFKLYEFKDEKKKRKLLKVLSRILKISERKLEKKLFEKKDFNVIAKFPIENLEKVRKAIKNVDYNPETKRYEEPFISSHVGVGETYVRVYPHKNFASNLLGFVLKDGRGGEGLEYEYDRYLLGSEKGYSEYIVYSDRGTLLVELNGKREGLPEDLKLSIDFRIQALVEEVKRKIVKKWKPKKVVIILMESDTGKVRAFTTYPDYDPNDYRKYFPERTRNFGTADLFEPGSTFKPFVIAYALEKGYIGKETLVEINYGKLKIDRKTIYDPHPYLRKKRFVTPEEILVYSSNVGAIRVGTLMEENDFKKIFKIFHLNKTPKVLKSEVNPQIANMNNLGNRAYASIGQGIAFNALHLLTSFNALITGYYVKPSFIEEEKRERKKVDISDNTILWLRKALIDVVEKGTGKRTKSKFYYIGGKTGTAQKYDEKTKSYSKEKLTAYFIGFFPKEPKFVGIILVDEPKGKEIYGGTVAAPYFKKIAEKVSVYYGIPPDKK